MLDHVLQNAEERFAYLADDLVLKAVALLDPGIWAEDPLKLSSYRDIVNKIVNSKSGGLLQGSPIKGWM